MSYLNQNPALSIQSVRVEVGSTVILSDIQFQLYPGELCALLGPSGAGKSTLIKVLLNLREPNHGKVQLAGQSIAESGPIGYVPQDDILHYDLSVYDELNYATQLRLPKLNDDQCDQLIDQVLARVELLERKHLRIRKLSGGQRKRVSVALELLTEPQLLILDEPTSGLDPGLEKKMMALFAQLASKGRIIMVATHAMESLCMCQILVLLMRGRLIFAGPPTAALDYFQVTRFAEIFLKLDAREADSWASSFSQSTHRRTFESRSMPASIPQPESPLPTEEQSIDADIQKKLAALKRKISD